MNIDWNFIFSVLTGVTAIIALVLTLVQIKSSNKQSLFDRRVRAYLITDGLVSLYKENINIFEKDFKDQPFFEVDYIFCLLTNNTYLEEISKAINAPLEEPGHRNLLIKREEMKQLALEVELIFKGIIKDDVSRFILAYQDLLFKMYQYQILLNKMNEYSQKFKKSLEESQKEMNEPELREKLFEAFNNLNNAN